MRVSRSPAFYAAFARCQRGRARAAPTCAPHCANADLNERPLRIGLRSSPYVLGNAHAGGNHEWSAHQPPCHASPSQPLPVFATSAFAHHGWDWAEDEKFELTGTIQEIYIGNPHAVLSVEAADGLWTVELAPPSRTRAAGFDENAAKAGDQVTAIGNRSRDQNEKRMKAVQIVVNGKTYNIYPDRIGA